MQIEIAIEINAPISAVWEVFGERFVDIYQWATSVDKSIIDRPVGEGAVRTCDIKKVGPVPAGQVTEKVTLFDSEKYALTYLVMSGVPGFMRRIENAWTFEKLGTDKTRATSLLTVDIAWYMLPMAFVVKQGLKKSVGNFIQELATHVETVSKK